MNDFRIAPPIVSASFCLRNGERVAVAYDPATAEARILTFGQRFGFAAIIASVGVALVCMAACFIAGRLSESDCRDQPLPGSLRPKPKPENKRPRRSGLAGRIAWEDGPKSIGPTGAQAPPLHANMPTEKPADNASTTNPAANVPCPVCRGTRELRISGGNGTMPCGRCGGTGRQPAQSA